MESLKSQITKNHFNNNVRATNSYNKSLDFANTVETDESHNIIPIVFIGGDGYDDNGSRVRFDYTDIIDHILIDAELVSLNSLKSYYMVFTSTNEDSGVYGKEASYKYYLGIKAEPGYHSIKFFLKNIVESPMVLGSAENPRQTISDPKMVQPFNSLKLLKRSIIGNNITMIPRKAYYDSGLETIIIPSTITSIGEEAFAYCSNLTSIIFKGTTQQWNDITKGTDWHNEVPATVVTCMDGDVSL